MGKGRVRGWQGESAGWGGESEGGVKCVGVRWSEGWGSVEGENGNRSITPHSLIANKQTTCYAPSGSCLHSPLAEAPPS